MTISKCEAHAENMDNTDKSISGVDEGASLLLKGVRTRPKWMIAKSSLDIERCSFDDNIHVVA